MSSRLAQSKEYQSFRRHVALQRKFIEQNDETKEWNFYDYGPRQIKCPLVFLPCASGNAEIYFQQMLALGSLGYRVISVDFPPCWTHIEFCEGFSKFLDSLNLDSVHIFGSALGGFLAQLFAQYRSKRVESLILSSTFCETETFERNANYWGMFSMVPEFALKRDMLSNFPSGQLEPAIADSVDFMVECLEGMSQKTLASRMKLNCSHAELKPMAITGKDRVTIIDCMDEVAISQKLRDQVPKFYPDAKTALLKSGGNFPYLSKPDEINMHIKIHFKSYLGAKLSPCVAEKQNEDS